MNRAALEAKRKALLAEGEALVKAHERLRLTPAGRPDHAAHRDRMRVHEEDVRTFLRDVKQPPSDT